ncbi:MAG: glycosyltransferase, partial [Actinomycetes bacterium]
KVIWAATTSCNVAASAADVIVTLNNDVTITDPEWLDTLVGYALLPDVGVVGPRLVNAEGVSDHDGITIAPYPQHLQRGVNYGWDDDFVHAIRNVAAVTGACQVFERRKWQEVRGMDETLAVTFNDVDLCLRMNLAGYESLFTPYVELIHIGKASRGTNEARDDHYRFIQYWNIAGGFDDPYCPARLELVGPRYTVRA